MEEEIPTTSALVIRPGDVLVVASSRKAISRVDFEEYRAQVLKRMPGLADVVLLAETTGLAAYRRSGDE